MEEQATESETETFPLHKGRCIMLAIFSFNAFANFLPMLQYTVVANITSKYYDVGSFWVYSTSVVFMGCFLLLFWPLNWLINRIKNLRVLLLMASGLTFCGAFIKFFSASRERIVLVIIGQLLYAFGQVFVITLPSKLARTWFGPEGVRKVCVTALVGTQLGISFGSLLSACLVKNSDKMDDIGYKFWYLTIVNVVAATAALGLVVLGFKAKPETPRSRSQVDVIDVKPPSQWEIVKAVWRNRSYQLILLSSGNSTGIYNCFVIVINTIYLHYFPGYEIQLGIILASFLLTGGCLGYCFSGYILDKYHHFKLTSFGAMFAGSLAYILVVLSLHYSQAATFFTIPFFGLFLGSTSFIGFHFGAEVMYPTPEAATIGVFRATCYSFGIVYTLLFTRFIDVVGYFYTHIIVVVSLLLSSFMIRFIRPNLRRRQANYLVLTNSENP